MRAMVVAVAFGLLAGCSEPIPETTDDASTGGSTPGDGSDPTATDTQETGANTTLPSFVIRATWNETVHVGVPFPVAIEADLTPAAGANATWRADLSDANGTIAGQEGTGLPASFNLTADRAGALSLTVNVSADGYQEANRTFNLTALVPESTPAWPEPLVWTGDTGSLAILCDPGAAGPSAGSDGYHYFDPGAVAGWRFQVDPSNLGTSWWTGADDSESLGSSGTVPAGRDNVGVCPDSDLDVIMGNVERTDYTMTLWHPDAPEPA